MGDVNGDGYADFLITSRGGVMTGPAVYVYLGSAVPDATAWNAEPHSLRAKIPGVGVTLAGAGDVNGDGYSDFLIATGGGGLDYDPPPPTLYLGSAESLGADWNAASSSQRIAVRYAAGDAAFGASMNGVGDVNGDGYSDFAIGAPGTASLPGAAHLYLGSAAPHTADWSAAQRIDLVSLDAGYAQFGYAVSGAGDVDGDGLADFLVAAPAAGTGIGVVHLYLGTAAPGPAIWNGTTSSRRIDVPNPNTVLGAFGITVAGRGDIDGDGYADFIAGGNQGVAYVHLGTATPSAATWAGASSPRRIDLTQFIGGVVARAVP